MSRYLRMRIGLLPGGNPRITQVAGSFMLSNFPEDTRQKLEARLDPGQRDQHHPEIVGRLRFGKRHPRLLQDGRN